MELIGLKLLLGLFYLQNHEGSCSDRASINSKLWNWTLWDCSDGCSCANCKLKIYVDVSKLGDGIPTWQNLPWILLHLFSQWLFMVKLVLFYKTYRNFDGFACNRIHQSSVTSIHHIQSTVCNLFHRTIQFVWTLRGIFKAILLTKNPSILTCCGNKVFSLSIKFEAFVDFDNMVPYRFHIIVKVNNFIWFSFPKKTFFSYQTSNYLVCINKNLIIIKICTYEKSAAPAMSTIRKDALSIFVDISLGSLPDTMSIVTYFVDRGHGVKSSW